MRVVVGLGNPGPEYQKTRHNIGFWVVDLLAERWSTKLSRRVFQALTGDAQWCSEKILLVQPQTYMNRSGEAVAKICDFWIKRGGGGAGGNRGIVSIIEALGSKDFTRVKIGIGRPQGRRDPAHFVLQPFTLQEEAFILPAVDRAVSVIEIILSEGVEKAMTLFHTSDLEEKS